MDTGDDGLARQAQTLPNLGGCVPIHFFTIFAILTILTGNSIVGAKFLLVKSMCGKSTEN
jgi:hypothetical protein